MNHRPIDIARIRRVALVLFGFALCVMVWPFLQPLPAKQSSNDEVVYLGERIFYSIENYALGDPRTVQRYQAFQSRLASIGIDSVRTQCDASTGERFVFAWLPTFSDGVLVTGIRANDPAAPMRVTGHVLDNLDLGVQHRIIDTRHGAVPAWQWSAIAGVFNRVLSPQRGATNNWSGHDGNNWYLEWCDHGRYAYQSRWSPEGLRDEAGLVRLGERLARIGKVDDVLYLWIHIDPTD